MQRQLAQEDQKAEAAADPDGSHHRAADRDGGRRARLRDLLQHEGDHERRKQASDRPADATDLGADEREDRSDVAGRRERSERTGEQPVLVERDQRRDERKRERPPTPEIDRAENDR